MGCSPIRFEHLVNLAVRATGSIPNAEVACDLGAEAAYAFRFGVQLVGDERMATGFAKPHVHRGPQNGTR